MADFLSSSMHEPPSHPSPHPSAEPVTAAPPAPYEQVGEAPRRPTRPPTRSRWSPGPLGRLVSLIVSVGLAWALTVAITAWLLGLFLARG